MGFNLGLGVYVCNLALWISFHIFIVQVLQSLNNVG